MASHVSRFLDIEAAVQDSSEESEGESELGFLDEMDADIEGNERVYQWKELDEWQEDEDSPDFLRSVAQAIESRHRSSHRNRPEEDEGSESLQLHLPSEADYLWRIKVKFGSERDVVLAIMQKASSSGSAFGLRAVFSRDSIQGSIYAEAPSQMAVERALRGIPGVARRAQQDTFLIENVDLHDRPLLLELDQRAYQPTLSENHWAWVKRGRYKHDLCLIRSVHSRSLQCDVTLVPRLHLSKKRKRSSRPPQRLFDVEEISHLFGERSVTALGKTHLFRGRVYRSGLYETTFHVFDLTSEGVNASEDELNYFRVDADLWSAAEDFVTPVRSGDKVRIVSGELQGTLCRVVGFKEMMVCISTGDKSIGPQEVMRRAVHKVFDLGDFVQVVYGPNRGASGFIIGLEQGTALIYSRVMVFWVIFNMSSRGTSPGVVYNATTTVTPATVLDDRRQPLTPTEHPTAQVLQLDRHALPEAVRPSDFISQQMYTGDRYRHMEVTILKGDAKRHFGVIRGMRVSAKGEPLFDVLTATRTVNTVLTYQPQELKERHMGLPLERARWIPAKFRKPKATHRVETLPPRPSTPPHSALNMNEAFTPNSLISMTPASRRDDPPFSPLAGTGTPAGPEPGKWLLNYRLAYHKLDVRIQGTTDIGALGNHSGRYEGQEGFVVFFSSPSSLSDSITVKVGYNQSQVKLQPRYLYPQNTISIGDASQTVSSASTSTTSISSIISVPGTRVVIIGPDLSNSNELVGSYGTVVQCPYVLGPGQAAIHIASPGPYWGTYAYFHVDSLCRSNARNGPVHWLGKVVY
ncbi:Transcription elongation factor SPT5 [Hypsizygus marmoreus]|uniref:Transcription elongation factor SPT5 n=1 Tax=Hypsizygus marmoreus TaxID=39966 RepID=A0A369JTN6_HYPMA|nr:Transcription elongation factor SPT5 [Hypsizygus marmoreus]